MIDENSFCIMPFIGICIEPGGDYKPCCKFSKWQKTEQASAQKNFQSDFFKSLRQDFLNGQKPSGCQRCWDDEKIGINSFRLNSNLQFNQERLKVIDKQEKLQVIDFGFGNLCNAKCITCGSHASSAWSTEDSILESVEGNLFQRRPRSLIADHYQWTQSELENLSCITLAQTEALLSHEFPRFIQQTMPFAQKQTLDFVTNGSYFPNQELIHQLTQFKQLDITLSIDGIGTQAEYLRYPLKWNVVENNVLRWLELTTKQSNVNLSARLTLSILNVFSINEVLQWWDGLRKKMDTKRIRPLQIGHADDPFYLNTHILSKEVRLKAQDLCDHPIFLKHMDAKTQAHSQEKMAVFYKFMDQIDKSRKLSARQTFRELFKTLDESTPSMSFFSS